MIFFRQTDPTNFVRIPLDVKGRLYASPMPYGPYDPHNTVFRMYLKKRVDRAVLLLFDEEIRKKCKKNLKSHYARHGIAVSQCAFKDLTAPLFETIHFLVREIEACLERGDRVAVHCNAGVGRTGVVTACVVRRITGMDGEAAIGCIKDVMMTQLTDEQERFIVRWRPDRAKQARPEIPEFLDPRYPKTQ